MPKTPAIYGRRVQVREKYRGQFQKKKKVEVDQAMKWDREGEDQDVRAGSEQTTAHQGVEVDRERSCHQQSLSGVIRDVGWGFCGRRTKEWRRGTRRRRGKAWETGPGHPKFEQQRSAETSACRSDPLSRLQLDELIPPRIQHEVDIVDGVVHGLFFMRGQ